MPPRGYKVVAVDDRANSLWDITRQSRLHDNRTLRKVLLATLFPCSAAILLLSSVKVTSTSFSSVPFRALLRGNMSAMEVASAVAPLLPNPAPSPSTLPPSSSSSDSGLEHDFAANVSLEDDIPTEVVAVDVPQSPDVQAVPNEAFVTINSIFKDHGPTSLLHAVQMSRIFPDSKTFVDMKVMGEPANVLKAFRALSDRHAPLTPPNQDIREFVDNHFSMENQMEDHVPQDWIPVPLKFDKISDTAYYQFALDLNERWKILSRKVSDDVRVRPELYTLLYLPHPVIVPGGRFREIYYWDSYWIIRGLLLSGMHDTVRGMLLNFVHLVKEHGLIPNGGRTYYLNRSQPPLFIQMVDEYVKATNDFGFVKENMPYLMAEFDYWMRNHMVGVKVRSGGLDNLKELRLARFNCEDAGPRPESYFEDYEVASLNTSDEDSRARMYWEMKTGAETGWDYSSRWMIAEDGSHVGELQDTKARYIIPVDLNAFLERNARILSGYAARVYPDQPELAANFKRQAEDLAEAIDELLWSPDDGVWYDFDILNNKQRRIFTPSNLTPLFTESFIPGTRTERCAAAVDYLISQNLGSYKGGVPTSFYKSGQQWDLPNCWPPLEHILVVGLEKTGLTRAKALAYQIAERRIRGAYANFRTKKHMFEKYDCSSACKIGGGGEYEIQIGFGWSNAVVLDFLDLYGDVLVSPNENEIMQEESCQSDQDVDAANSTRSVRTSTPDRLSADEKLFSTSDSEDSDVSFDEPELDN